MIDHLDNLLRHLFISEVAGINVDAQVRFEPPDQQWRNYVNALANNALNVYLVDLRENRELRSNERVRDIRNGEVTETPAPRRIDCHYLITAWSPAAPAPAVEPTVDEHALLYAVTGVLMNADPLIPRQVYAPNPLPAAFPQAIADAELPVTILPVEGFSKLAELWGTMDFVWKPAVYLIVTLPVVLEEQIAGPMVTTRITEYRISGQPGTAEVWIQIGGHVRDTTHPLPDGSPAPVTKAWVQLETLAGQRLQMTRTDELGRFTFGELHAGNYRLRVSAVGLGEVTRNVDVPSPSGEYDLQF